MDNLLGAATNKSSNGVNPADLIKDGSAESFVADVMETSMTVPVIVDFWAPWCGPCKQLGPLLEKVVREARGAVRMVKINVDENQTLAGQLRVQSVPTVYAFKGGRPFDAFTGALPESQIRSFIQKLTAGVDAPLSMAELVEQANVALAEGDLQSAGALFQEILSEEPENTAAIGGLIRTLVAAGDFETASAYLAQIPEKLAQSGAIAAARTALELATSAQAVGPLAQLRQLALENPDDPQARFDLALGLYAAGETEQAIDELLDLFLRNRTWNEQAAKTQLLQIFEALGHDHPLTLSGRRRLSTLLFS